jgi:hypothetical protein
LGPLNLIVSVFLVPESVLIEPVIGFGLCVKGITKVGWSGGGHPVGWSVGTKKVVDQLLVLPIVVFCEDTETSLLGA